MALRLLPGLADSLTAKPRIAASPARQASYWSGDRPAHHDRAHHDRTDHGRTDHGRTHHGRAAAARRYPLPAANLVLLVLLVTASRRPDRPRLPLTDAHHRIEREARPPMRCAGRRGRPPQLERQYGRWLIALLCAIAVPALVCCRIAAMPYSERCCGIPARRARTSVSRYRRCPPSVRIDVSFPAFAHLVTVFGSTLNIVATSAGVSSGSASGVRADILTASPPGPVLRSLPTSLAVRGF